MRRRDATNLTTFPSFALDPMRVQQAAHILGTIILMKFSLPLRYFLSLSFFRSLFFSLSLSLGVPLCAVTSTERRQHCRYRSSAYTLDDVLFSILFDRCHLRHRSFTRLIIAGTLRMRCLPPLPTNMYIDRRIHERGRKDHSESFHVFPSMPTFLPVSLFATR